MITLAITIVHTIASVTARWPLGAGASIAGPGTSPWMRNAPMRIAVLTLAGTPKATVVTRLPPNVELLAAPGPSTPSTAPRPKRLAVRRALRRVGVGEPLRGRGAQPGMTETNVPIALHRRTSHQWRNVSARPATRRQSAHVRAAEMLSACTARSMSSGIAKKPMVTGTRPMPSQRKSWPNV